MKKNLFTILGLSLTSFAFAQNGGVGINTEAPMTTLDVVGRASDVNKLDGITAPRLTGDELKAKSYTAAQTGAFVYITTAFIGTASAQTLNVTSPGYYYFDGTVWVKSQGNDWKTSGNAGTIAGTNFLGTSDNVDLIFKRNNVIGGALRLYTTSFGNNSLPLSVPDNVLTAYGSGTLQSTTTGSYNDAFGYIALNKLTNGNSNVALGSGAGATLTSASGNTLTGVWTGNAITTGSYNTLYGLYAGSKLTTGNVNVGVGNSVFDNLTSGYKNVAMGQSAAKALTTGSYNTIIGQVAGAYITTENKNVMVGAQTGAYIQGNNNVFIGTGAGHSNSISTMETVNNRLVIHSNATLIPNTNNGAENPVDLSASWTNGLIIGDFADRWVRLNGNLQLNPSYHPADATYTKTVVSKPDGTTGLADRIIVPTPPSSGNYILQSINGNIQWVAAPAPVN